MPPVTPQLRPLETEPPNSPATTRTEGDELRAEVRRWLQILLHRAWIIAALIIGSVVYLSVIERLKDFAVFKAIGVPTRSIMSGLALQAVVVTLFAAVTGLILSKFLKQAVRIDHEMRGFI